MSCSSWCCSGALVALMEHLPTRHLPRLAAPRLRGREPQRLAFRFGILICRCLWLRKSSAGNQTGADRAGLDWAIEHGTRHGGWCPRGRIAISPRGAIANLAWPPRNGIAEEKVKRYARPMGTGVCAVKASKVRQAFHTLLGANTMMAYPGGWAEDAASN